MLQDKSNPFRFGVAILAAGALTGVVGRLVGLSRPDHELLMASTGGSGMCPT
jgi:hypothetical protein